MSPATNSQDGGSIDNNHLLYNLTGYEAPYLQNSEELHSGAPLSPDIPIPQDDTYRRTLFNEEQHKAIQALVDVPDDIVVQQLALIRSDHESRSTCMTVREIRTPYFG